MLTTVFENATIVDGTGAPRYTTDVGLAGERIALIGDLRERDALERIRANGLVLAPGFIDVHSHSDARWLSLPRCDSKIAQGVTTEIGGNCGTSIAPSPFGEEWKSFSEFFSLVERNGVALNVASLVGLSTTRSTIAGDDDRPLTKEELSAQTALVRIACEQGALGASSGLIYIPGRWADTNELIACARGAREGGSPLYASHVRSEGDELIDSIAEALAVGEGADVAVQCSHHKATYPRNWGRVHATLEMIDCARSRGADVYADVYPYTASWTELAVVLPARIRDGGRQKTLERLRDPAIAAATVLEMNLHWNEMWDKIKIADVPSERNASLAGMTLAEIAKLRRLSPARTAIEVLSEEELEVSAIYFSMNEDDVDAVLSAGFTSIGSDASIRTLDAPGVPHPRAYGTFPRVFARFVRQRGTIALEEAVRRMTSLPAQTFGLRDRGEIAAGKFADLVLFDEGAIADTATYDSPKSFPVGIERVYVNGAAVRIGTTFTDARPGRVLRSNA